MYLLRRLMARQATDDTAGPLPSVHAPVLKMWLADGNTVLIDIREAEEHARHALPGALSVPLSRLPAALMVPTGTLRVVFHCQSGNRVRLAAARLAATTRLPTYALSGGINGWNAL